MHRPRLATFCITLLDILLLSFFAVLTYGIFFPSPLQSYIFGLDSSVAGIVAGDTPHWLYAFMNTMTYLADPVVMVIFAVIALLVLVHIHEEAIGALLTGSMVVGGLLSLAVKVIILRPRPTALASIDRFGAAFPSAHALLSIIFYGFLAYALARVYKKGWQRIVLFAGSLFIIACIGYSRIVIGAHWFSDVIGGWLLGSAILGTLITSVFRLEEWHAKKWHPDRHVVMLGIILAVSLITFLSVFDLMRYTL